MYPRLSRAAARTVLVPLRRAAAWWATPTDRHRSGRGDRGQATTEYALVLLGAALVALLLVAWATAGGGAGKIGRLFDKVIDIVTSKL